MGRLKPTWRQMLPFVPTRNLFAAVICYSTKSLQTDNPPFIPIFVFLIIHDLLYDRVDLAMVFRALPFLNHSI